MEVRYLYAAVFALVALYTFTFASQIQSGRWAYDSLARQQDRSGTWTTGMIRFYGATAGLMAVGFLLLGVFEATGNPVCAIVGFALIGVSGVMLLVLHVQAMRARPASIAATSSRAADPRRNEVVIVAIGGVCVLAIVGITMVFHLSLVSAVSMMVIATAVLVSLWSRIHTSQR